MNFVEYNEILKNEYETRGDINTLIRYVISETLPPIAEYENAVKIIRKNYKTAFNTTLLIIGSYLLTECFSEKNEMLSVLNEIMQFLTEKEKAIVYYLNAVQIRARDNNYKSNELYKMYLQKSVEVNTPFVFNRVWLAQISAPETKRKLKAEAIKNIDIVNDFSEIEKMPVTVFTEPDFFINERILGTNISSEVEDWLLSMF